MIALSWIEPGVQCQLGQTDNRIHRGSNFVAHVGQKRGLHQVGLLRGVLGFLDLVLGQYLVGNIRAAADESDEIAGRSKPGHAA